jgi:dipeptide/tripeptide permease
MVLQYILMILVLLLAFPIGFLLSKLTKEELIQGRTGFKILIWVFILSLIFIVFSNIQTQIKITLVFTLIFIIIITLISLKQSFYSKKTKKQKKRKN